MERPLNIAPDVWARMESMQTRRGINVQMERTAAPRTEEGDEESDDPLIQIDLSIDGLVANTKRLLESIEAAKKMGRLNREETMALDEVKELVDTAIAPYLSDIIKELDVFESVEV